MPPMPDREPPGNDLREGDTLEGVVVRSTGSWYEVRAGDETVSCTVRGKFRLSSDSVTNPVAVGDRVTIRMNADETGSIFSIHDRHSKLSRRAAGRRQGREHIIVANVDVVWTVQSVRLPQPNPGFIDRILVMAEAHELEAGLVINKIDLMTEEDESLVNELQARYASLGYHVLMTSASSGQGVEAFGEALQGRTSVLAGPSGVGKSTLLNAVEPDLSLRTSEVSERTRKGRHTTTYASLIPLSSGGYVADTPGIREFGILDIEPWELSHFFVEMRPHLEGCRFPTCTHDHEPACAVKEAVAAGEISQERYQSYINILHSIQAGDADVGR